MLIDLLIMDQFWNKSYLIMEHYSFDSLLLNLLIFTNRIVCIYIHKWDQSVVFFLYMTYQVLEFSFASFKKYLSLFFCGIEYPS